MIGLNGNGRRELVSFGDFTGKAGITERDGTLRVAFFGTHRQMQGVTAGTIGGARYEVLHVAASDHVKGMVVLTVQPITEEPA